MVLKYNNTAGRFEASLNQKFQTLNGLTDVNTTGVLNGDPIVYVLSKVGELANPTYNLTNLQDVYTAGATNGSISV